eukprot:TRINITY_DN49065_c0_g1_i1.p1 TRINITY_DN49065_c0_g1~~TRINITY_DN49065_c0_g1_i1.p1  ORF type:complete len:567 (-),score=173.81 TRINITY_DN49065_c0_g1_i1:66-1766(-)
MACSKLSLLALSVAFVDCAKTSTLEGLQANPRDPFNPWGGKAEGMMPGSSEPWIEMIKHTDIIRTPEEKCICELGQYFNFKDQRCRDLEDVGFDCSGFPKRHHAVICRDGYTCKGVNPQCRPCEHEDYCTSGSTRHDTNCLKENHMSGNACVTVEVTVPAVTVSETARVTETATSRSKKTLSSSATATASHSATETDQAFGKADADATESVKVLETGKSQAEMEVVTTGGGSAHHRNVDSEGISVAEGSGSASAHAEGEGRKYGTSIATEERSATSEVTLDYEAKAKKTETGEATVQVTIIGKSLGSACVPHTEAIKLSRSGSNMKEEVVAKKIQHVGLKTAYERAVALAKKRAYKKGKDDAKKQAKAEAQEEAESKALRAAKSKADQEADYRARVDGQAAADAKAKNDAQAKAEERAKLAAEASARRLARQTAQGYADQAAKEDAQRKASAKAKGLATQKASASAKDTAESEAYVNAQNSAANTAAAEAREEAAAEKERRSNLRKQKAQAEYDAKVARAKKEYEQKMAAEGGSGNNRQGKSQSMDGNGDNEALAKISRPGGILKF